MDKGDFTYGMHDGHNMERIILTLDICLYGTCCMSCGHIAEAIAVVRTLICSCEWVEWTGQVWWVWCWYGAAGSGSSVTHISSTL